MKDKKTIFLSYVSKYSRKKRTWAILAIVILIIFFVFKPQASTLKITVDNARYVDLKQTVLATGQVTSNTDLNLSFNSSGVVKSLRVKVGDKVKRGDILANIDQGSELATLTQARGALAAAQARLKKIIEGSTSEEVALAQVTFDQTKLTEETLVRNAYQNLLNSTPEAVPAVGTNDYQAPTISGTYNLGKEGVIKIKMYSANSSSGFGFNLSGLVEGSGTANTTTPQPLSNSGLYIKFPSSTDSNVSDWVITIPNKKAPDYLSNYNAYEQALSASDLAINQKAAELAIKKAQARQSDVDLAKADIISAQGQVDAAVSKYEDTIIRAPDNGTITSVDIKIGELSEVQKPIITLQDVSSLYIEAKINESSIANILLGQKVSITFDAFGKDKLFDGTVVHIDPSAVTTDGIVNYKIKASINSSDKGILPGMNTDINILTAEKDHALVIPKAAIKTKDMKTYVNVITDKKDDTKYKEREIQTGLLGDGNLIEVVSGLSEGESVAIISK